MKVLRVDKYMADAKSSKDGDLVDGLGVRWEAKTDRIFGGTGNFYVELQSLEDSKADKHLIFAGLAYVIATDELRRLAQENISLAKRGGDGQRSIGIPLPAEVLAVTCEEIINL